MIYLAIDGKRGAGSIFPMIAQLLFIFVIFIGVVIIAIYATKWFAKARYVKKSGDNLQILDSMSLGYQNGIHLLRCGKKYILIGITKDRITKLAELEEKDIEFKTVEDMENKDGFANFEKYLSNFLNKDKEDDDNG